LPENIASSPEVCQNFEVKADIVLGVVPWGIFKQQSSAAAAQMSTFTWMKGKPATLAVLKNCITGDILKATIQET